MRGPFLLFFFGVTFPLVLCSLQLKIFSNVLEAEQKGKHVAR